MDKDFIGFSYDGIHSSTLNILRVASSDRYTEELFPEINDRVTDLVGMNGEYYFGSNFGAKEIEVSIAFDSMTEEQFRKMRRLFGSNKNCELVFDERPYKVYLAKVKDPIELEYVCFDEPYKTEGIARDGLRVVSRETNEQTGETSITREQVTPWEYDFTRKQRIYKGEGKINFICYFPFAKQQFKTLDLYRSGGNVFTTYDNVDEWAASSGILEREIYDNHNLDRVVALAEPNPTNYNLQIPVYNPGDLDIGFYLYIPFIPVTGLDVISIVPDSGDYIKIYGDDNGLLLRPIYGPKVSSDTGILIDSVNHIIQGVTFDPIIAASNRRQKPWELTGTVYNEYIALGDFPHIRKTDWYLDNEQFKQAIYLNCKDRQGLDIDRITIKYDYLYF